jgi:hypothetical protein
MEAKMSKCTLLMKKGSLTLHRGFEGINVQAEDCLGQVSNPISNGENTSFEVTQEQSNVIRKRTANRQNRAYKDTDRHQKELIRLALNAPPEQEGLSPNAA